MSLFDLLQGEGGHKILRPSGSCVTCPRKRVDYVPATLQRGHVLWLGEAPGATEVKKQEGFTGESGQLLREEASKAGVIGPWSFSNTVHCRPPNNDTPDLKEIQCCLSQFVLEEIRGYPFVVLCGNVPLQALFPGAKANRFRGNVAWHPDFPGQRFYTIYHPAYILRRKDMEGEFRKQLQRLARIINGEGPLPWRVLRGGEEYNKALQAALASPMISLDLETTRLESWLVDSRIRSLALTADGKTALFAHEDDPHWVGTIEAVREFLEQKDKQVVGHNIPFELEWLETELGFRVRLRKIHDLPTIWYEAKQYKMPSLKELVSRELDGYRYLVYQPSHERDLDLLANYNAEDVVHPLHLFLQGMQRLKPITRELVTRVSGPSGYLLRRMTRAGFYLRQDYRRTKIEEYKEKRKQTIAAWKAEDPTFIPTVHESGNGLHEYIFRIKQLPVVNYTEKGTAPAIDRSAIKTWIQGGATYLRHLLNLRKIDKLLGTYLTAYDKHVGPDSRVHSNYTTTLTDTARSSSSSPNLQNVPREKEIRDLFGAPPGKILIESDLAQIEFRIMVCLAKDTNGIRGYLQGSDAHTMTARSFCSGSEPTEEERNRAKLINFALLYGGDWYNVQNTARDWYNVDWPESQCREFVEGFFHTYPGIKRLHQTSEEELIRNKGWFESVTGHVFHYSDWNSPDKAKRDHAFRSALNAKAQGPAAQICFLIGIEANYLFLERGFHDVFFVNTVHDSLLTEVPGPDVVEPVILTIEDARALAYEWVKGWLVVPLIMDHKYGQSWGQMVKYKEKA